MLLKQVVYQPYFQVYGELNLDQFNFEGKNSYFLGRIFLIFCSHLTFDTDPFSITIDECNQVRKYVKQYTMYPVIIYILLIIYSVQARAYIISWLNIFNM